MKIHNLFILVSLVISCVLFTGCASTNQKNAGTFLKTVSTLNITLADFTQSTKTPIYSHTESIEGVQKTANGDLSVTNLKASFAIPLWGTTWDLSITSLVISKDSLPATPSIVTNSVLAPATVNK